MKTYNEIYPAERYADKILTYLRKVAAEKPNMYAKTKKRYEDLASVMMECSGLILSILEEDSLVPKNTDEFDELSSAGDDLKNKFDQLSKKFQQAEKFSSDSKMNSRKSDGDPIQPGHSSAHIYYRTCADYHQVLKEASACNFGYSEVNKCAQLLYKWFHTRFLPDVPDPDFLCKIEYLPSWITNFILVFGKYYEDKRINVFESTIERWCNRVESGTAGNYAIPFEIYKLDNDIKKGACKPDDYTISAVIINDILSSGKLYQLGPGEYEGDILYDPGDLPRIVNDRNPSLFPKIRTRISKMNQLISEIGLTPVGDGDADE